MVVMAKNRTQGFTIEVYEICKKWSQLEIKLNNDMESLVTVVRLQHVQLHNLLLKFNYLAKT